jgi:predicted CxxxxCH...CXXCH cytochrome family protein
VSCYPCHGPSAPHPRQWLSTDTYRHDNTATGNAAVCAYCHRSAAGTPGCFNSTLCHGAGGVAHAVPYDDNSHYTVTLATFPGSCGPCHDVSAPSAKAGPVCQACHVAASPLAAANCTSCHAVPPDGLAPAGTAYPNIAGSHSPHIALNAAGSPVGCNTCHNGLGSRTLNHYDRANARPGKDALRVPPGDIVFPAECNAKSGTAAFNAATRACSNVICHGGQATPDWQTATPNAIDVPNACLACHVSGTTQYNSYSSGSHDRHTAALGLSASTCKRCHDVAKVNGAGHFQNLVTPAFEQPASATVLPAVGYDGNRCNPQGGGLTGCHASKKW